MPDRTVTLAAFRHLVGASKAELDGLISSGVLPQPTGRDRRLPLREAARAYLEHLRAHLATARAGASASRAQDARADAAALELAVEQRELIDAEDAHAALDAVCGVVATQFTMIPARVTRDRIQRETLRQDFFDLQSDLAADLAGEPPISDRPNP
ncbi:hypothetical protein LV780_03740 [Cereibacter azotoformans]|uniref:Uncharacterized protein n=1 Tax=Cereibacter azotoformans TaxID=43057 RepID=A0A2T5JWN5_9RHOB|nr:hypothetical protein [Cereibacter azotoformans]MBO4169312.1 hypothetical protein [Cereibacter azotoformans]PTR14589.1 hypothetical protein C8J28_11661 [Cereibacter azotoformans]UIJ31300.1 hypothetical protein LV780_03740 [Cereibacter azotoformans]